MLHISIWRGTVLLIAVVPLIYYLLATIAAIRFFTRVKPRKQPDFTPPVSVLKPVRGVDFGSYENFTSFCRQNYPNYEVLFCVNDMSDAAVPVIRQIIAEHPEKHIRIFSGAPQVGSNRKVNNLALLACEAQFELLVQSDGDVRVGPDYLREVVAPFADPSVGVISCFYRGIAQRNLGAELEAIGASSDFFAGALIAEWMEGVTFALGASVATTKSWLAKIGGYESLADLLADDYEIGNRLHRAGAKVLLSREIVWTMYPAQTLMGFWDHQVRWARTVRLVRPVSFVGLLFTHGLPWATLACFIAPSTSLAIGFLLAYLLLRLTMAWTVGVWALQDDLLRRKLWLVPLRDLINFGVWLASFASNRVTWSGLKYEVQNGKLVPADGREPGGSS